MESREDNLDFISGDSGDSGNEYLVEDGVPTVKSSATSKHDGEIPQEDTEFAGETLPPSTSDMAATDREPFQQYPTGNSQGGNNQIYTLPMGMLQTRAPPVIHKIIPAAGPIVGGIEVTILGAGFFQGLELCFGDQKPVTTTFWSESSLACLLPPSPVTGAVAITYSAREFPRATRPPIFKYVNDNEDKLSRTALSVLGHKMTGRMVDVSDMARKIINGCTLDSSGSPSSSSQIPRIEFIPGSSLELQLLTCLDLVDLDDSTHRTRLDLKRPTGHTMLHLSCSLGYRRFVAALLARGANPDARDRGGFTPLHIAAIHNHSGIAKCLIQNGADVTIRSLSGLSAADIAQSGVMLRTIRRSAQHMRSRSSGGSLHSRSTISLRSLWEPITELIDRSQESPEYTLGDLEDEDPDEQASSSMRRPNPRRQKAGEHEQELAPPTMALAAFKDQLQQQLQQFQESMHLHFQNLPDFPQIPDYQARQFQQQIQQFYESMHLHFQNLPDSPQMPDYQALQQRMQQLVPGMSTVPDSEQAQGWDMATKNIATAPPSYEELFPEIPNQERAFQAAFDAEAVRQLAILSNQLSTAKAIYSKMNEPHISKSKSLGAQENDENTSQSSSSNLLEEEAVHCTYSYKMTIWSSLWPRLMNFWFPPAAGDQRIYYACGCGELSYLDVKELSPGGVERFRQRLFKNSAAADTSPRKPPSSAQPILPPQAYLRSNKSTPQDTNQRYQPSQSLQHGNNQVSNTIVQNQDPQYLLLCVNTRNSTTLVQLEIGTLTSDQYLFQKIYDAYKKTREEHEWRIFMLIPLQVRNLFQRILKRAPKFPKLPNYLNILPMLSRALSIPHLHKVASGDFVRFQLIPIGEKCYPRWFKTRQFPPESEVTARKYLYEPVPMDDVEIADIPLAHLLKPGPHLDAFWLNTFPKKLSVELQRPAGSGKRVIGWGIRINESLRWSAILLLILISSILISINVVIYSIVTSDNSSAFGLGAFLAALLTLYLTYQYLSWKEEV